MHQTQTQTFSQSHGRESNVAACGHAGPDFSNYVENLDEQLPFGANPDSPGSDATVDEGDLFSVAGAADLGAATDGDPKEPLSERFVEDHLPMVRCIAWRIRERLPQGVPIDDLISAGILGLMDAYFKYDPGRGVKFKTYAQFRVRGAILDSLRGLDWGPRELRVKGRRIDGRIHALTQKLGRVPDSTEVAASLGMSLPGYHKLVAELSNLGSANWGEQSWGEEERIVESLPGDPNDDPLQRCLRSEMRQRLESAIAQLPARERLVISLYYYEEMSAREIAECLGVAQSRVWQIRHSAISRLRTGIIRDKMRPRPPLRPSTGLRR